MMRLALLSFSERAESLTLACHHHLIINFENENGSLSKLSIQLTIHVEFIFILARLS
jgi:hypothetical protein